MLREFLRKITSFSLIKQRLLISVPSGITDVEERAIIDAGLQAGAIKVFLIEEPVAAAIGANLPIEEASGRLVIDIGGGTTDIAGISLSGVVHSASIKVAGYKFDEALIKYVRKRHAILIGERTAEELKLSLGCVYPKKDSVKVEVKGRCLLTGLPKLFTISSEEMLEAYDEVCEQILDAIHSVLEIRRRSCVANISQKRNYTDRRRQPDMGAGQAY